MDLIDDTIDPIADQFDLEAENVSGVFSNLTLLSIVLASLMKRNRPFPKTKPLIKDEYDYIIVGGGTAGSVMANRLSENPCVTVLLLEAGGNAPILSEIPSFARLFYGSNVDWLYKTTPQKYAGFSQENNMVRWNSGKALGGSSVINAMLFLRGNKRNYDDWEAEGATGWGYKGVLPYFRKLEDNKNIAELDSAYHAVGGPMTVEKPNYIPEIKAPILNATTDMGYKMEDVNGRIPSGIYDLQATVRNQQRCSTAKAYLVPAEDRPNLYIVKGAFVRKILIDDKKTAYGVEVDWLLKTHKVRANKEVIISAGSVRTAQLLMLSGIGPKAELEKFGIDVVADLPVGHNLQDHYAANLVYQISDTITPVIAKILNPLNILDYVANRHGPLCAPTQCTVLAFLDGMNATEACLKDFPKLELYFAEYAAIDAKWNSNLKSGVYEKFYAHYELKPLYICYSCLLQPKSRGSITLNSKDPYDYPKINPNYYQDESDLKDVVEGLKICQAVAAHKAMKKVNARPLDRVFPGCEKEFAKNEDEYLTCQAKQIVNTFWHPVGTARMGDPNDPRSVVDPQLRVLRVKGLRVVNAAVMPIVPSGNTNVPTMMVAEKAYDMMKDDIKCPQPPKIIRRRRRGRTHRKNRN